MPNVNKNLNVSKSRIDDEFYTPYEVVDKELKHYDLSGMRIYCPFDSEKSAFVKYLVDNMRRKEIASVTYTSLHCNEVVTVTPEGESREIINSGNFLGDDVQNLIRDDYYDIIITNPPFSIIDRVFESLFNAEKRFLILASNIVISRKSIRQHYINDEIVGSIYTHDDSIFFDRPDGIRDDDVACTFWHNLGGHRPPFYYSGHNYDHMKYEFLTNGCLFCRRWATVPDDWYGLMAVPVNGAWRINREQFEVLGLCSGVRIITPLGLDTGKDCFTRIVVKRKK